MGIPYAVVGAFAASFHGIPRSTNDADAKVWLKESGKTEKDLVSRLAGMGYRVTLNLGDIDDPISGVIVIEDEHENRLDLLLGVRGMDNDAAKRSVVASLMGASLCIIAAEDLIAMKIFAGGVQDLEDVRGILQVSGKHLSLTLLRGLARRYGVEVAQKLDDILLETPPSQ